MKRRAHLLLALLLGLLLQSVAAGGLAGGSGETCTTSIHGAPADPLEPVSRDVTAATQPFVGGSGPEPFAASAFHRQAFDTLRDGRNAPSLADPFFPTRPVYLTTQRLRL